jgi:hypothetical protein
MTIYDLRVAMRSQLRRVSHKIGFAASPKRLGESWKKEGDEGGAGNLKS